MVSHSLQQLSGLVSFTLPFQEGQGGSKTSHIWLLLVALECTSSSSSPPWLFPTSEAQIPGLLESTQGIGSFPPLASNRPMTQIASLPPPVNVSKLPLSSSELWSRVTWQVGKHLGYQIPPATPTITGPQLRSPTLSPCQC